jgi:hypothetical protein
MADFLGIKRERLSWATREKIVEKDEAGWYHPEIVTLQWLTYERGRSAKKEGKSEFERQRARLARAKAEVAERRLAMLDRALLGTDDIVETIKTVCVRIRSKLQAALPRIARGCFHAPSLTEALAKARSEFDLLLNELSALNDVGSTNFEVVKDANGKSAERSTAVRGKRKRTG